jgi:hypothetical protein
MSTSQGVHYAKKAMRVTCWFCCMLCGLILLAPECTYGGDKKTASNKSAKNVKSSVSELSSRNQSLLARYSAEVETAADKIISGSPSPGARRQALVWKAEAIPVMQSSLLNTDPIAAVLDTWAFLFQMTTFMERPALQQTMGNHYPVVTETLRNMETQMERLVQTVAPKANLADLRQRVRDWAEAHPIQGSLASRQSADPDVIKKVGETNLGTFGSIKELAESMGDLSARLDAYNLYLPKEARWQAELLVGDLMRDPQHSATRSDFGELANAAAKLDSERLSIQDFVHQERLQTLEAVQRQRIGTLAALHAERLGATADLHAERLGLTTDLHKERLGATADLRGEREAVLDALREHEVAVMNNISATSEQDIQHLGTKGHDLIDHLFLRAIELMLLTLALCFLVAWILLRRFSTRPTERAERTFDRAA